MMTIALALLKRFWPYLLLIAGVVLAIIWFNQYLDSVEQRGYDRRTAEYIQQENKDLKAALEETARLNHVIEKAENEAKQREETNRVLSARNASLLGKLRDTDASIDKLVSSATADALRDATRAFSSLFGDCRKDFDAMGRAAAGHLSDVKKLEASWPVKAD